MTALALLHRLLGVDRPGPDFVEHLAELAAGGQGLLAALRQAPRHTLSSTAAARLDRELAALSAGGALRTCLTGLGLSRSAAAVGLHLSAEDSLAAALRADAAALRSAQETRTQVMNQLLPLVATGGGLLALALIMVFVVIPNQLELLGAGAAPAADADGDVIAGFRDFRTRWLLACAMCLALVGGLAALLLTWGRSLLQVGLERARTQLPLFSDYTLASARAELLEALACDGPAGIPRAATVRRLAAAEGLSTLAAEQRLVAERLQSGDGWSAAVHGTSLDEPTLLTLGDYPAGRCPIAPLRLAAREQRAQALRSLRWALIVSAALLLAPPGFMIFRLVKAAVVTSSVAEIRGLGAEIDAIEEELGAGSLNNR